VENKVVVDPHEILHLIFLETDEPFKGRTLLPGAVNAMNHVAPLLLTNKKQMKDFELGKGKIQN